MLTTLTTHMSTYHVQYHVQFNSLSQFVCEFTLTGDIKNDEDSAEEKLKAMLAPVKAVTIDYVHINRGQIYASIRVDASKRERELAVSILQAHNAQVVGEALPRVDDLLDELVQLRKEVAAVTAENEELRRRLGRSRLAHHELVYDGSPARS